MRWLQASTVYGLLPSAVRDAEMWASMGRGGDRKLTGTGARDAMTRCAIKDSSQRNGVLESQLVLLTHILT